MREIIIGPEDRPGGIRRGGFVHENFIDASNVGPEGGLERKGVCSYLFHRELGPQAAPHRELPTALSGLFQLLLLQHGASTLFSSRHRLLHGQLFKEVLYVLLVESGVEDVVREGGMVERAGEQGRVGCGGRTREEGGGRREEGRREEGRQRRTL